MKKGLVKATCLGAVLVAALAVGFSYAPGKAAKASELIVKDAGGVVPKESNDMNDCEINITEGVVSVVYNGQALQKNKDYWVNVLEQKFLVQSVEGVDGSLNTYEVVTYYTISGKGDFTGVVNKTVTSTKTLYERN